MSIKISARIPEEIHAWILTQMHSRKCDFSAVVVDAIRSAAQSAAISDQQQQITALLSQLIPTLEKRFEQLENHVVQSVFLTSAVAKQSNIFEQAQAGFSAWKSKKGEQSEG